MVQLSGGGGAARVRATQEQGSLSKPKPGAIGAKQIKQMCLCF